MIAPACKIVLITLCVMRLRHAEHDDYQGEAFLPE
jgi:hypothetical protein